MNDASDMPVGWEEVRLRDLGEIVAGGTPSRTNLSYWGGTIPWVIPGEITQLRSKYLTDTAERITQEGLSGSAAKLLPRGSVVVTSRATLGEAAIAGVSLATNQGFKTIIPNVGTDSVFTYYLMSEVGREMTRLASGTTFLEISKSDFENIRVRRPKLPEQRRIAAVLEAVDEAVARTEAVIAKLKHVRAGLLHDLLTRGLDEHGQLRDPIAHPELFQDSPLGRLPRAWRVGVLNDLVSQDRPIVYGILMPGRGFPGGVPVIKVKDIKDGQIDTTDLLLTDPRIDEAYRRSRVRPHDLLFTIRGTVGRTAFVPPELNEANITQDTARISLRDANPLFVARWLEMPEPTRFIETHTIGVAVRGINLADLRRTPVVVPPKEEQDLIAEIILSIEERISTERTALYVVQKIKSGLASDLLTGRVRIPEVVA